MGLKEVLGRLQGGQARGGALRRWLLPGIAAILLLSVLFSDHSGVAEVEPGEVAVKYNNTGLGLFGEPASVVKEQGVLTFLPLFQRVEKLDVRPQIFTMEGTGGAKGKEDHNNIKRLTVRANDGSNFYFERVEIHYQVIPGMAAEVIRQNGRGDDYKWRALQVHSRELLRDEFGRHSFLEIADPSTYGAANARAKEALNTRLAPLGIEVSNILISKPKFDDRVEAAIEDRQEAEQEVQVQEEKRNKLRQQRGNRLQQVEQEKNAEFQQLNAELEARKQQAQNAFIAARREADIYFIEKEAAGVAYRDEKVTRAKANEVAYRKQAEGVVAQIRAVGEQGADVLNREIAEHVFPQLERVSASPFAQPTTPVDIRHINAGGNP
ncbi:MAG: SPFH domain-containing protein [bacterium]